MNQYSVVFRNNASISGNAILYQTQQGWGQMFPVAWFSRPSYPSSQVQFAWENSNAFVWGETGRLMPGVLFQAAQMMNADPNSDNMVTFSVQSGYAQFSSLTSGGQPGSLTIQQASSVPMNQQYAVGVAVGGSPVTVIQAMPNMSNAFQSSGQIWVTFGQAQQGEVLNAESITLNAPLQFPADVFALVVTLNPDNTLTVSSQ